MAVLLCFLIMLCFVTAPAAEDWPARTITVICGSSAGGLTDTSTRVIVGEMSKLLGVAIIVTNVTGGGGGIAAQNVFQAPNDGNTWHAQGAQIRTMGVLGLHDSSPKDWYVLPTVGYIGAIAVKEDSPYKTLADLIEALKKNPGKIPYAASYASTSWAINMELLRKATGLRGRFVPYTGSSASQVGLLSGDVQFVMTGIGEQAELLRGKKIRGLAVFHDKPYHVKGYGEVPTITDFLPEMKPHLPFPAWASISMRADIPKPILRKVDEALSKAMKTNAVKEYCEKFDVVPMGVVGNDAQKLYYQQASVESWLLYEAGVAKKSPADLGIPKP